MALLLSLSRNKISVRASTKYLELKSYMYSLYRLINVLLILVLFMPLSHAGNGDRLGLSIDPTHFRTPTASSTTKTVGEFAVGDTIFTLRFSNPRFPCDSLQYLVDVEFQSNFPNTQLFGINLRYWYDDSKLEFQNYVMAFPTSYQAEVPVITTLITQGPAWFNFAGAADYVNGGIQHIGGYLPPYAHYIATAPGWTKLFTIAFHIDDPNADPANFFTSVIGDLEQYPQYGGFLPGNDGIVMTAITITGGSVPTTEHTIPFNWNYIYAPPPPPTQPAPYGTPANTYGTPLACAPIMTCPGNITIACGASTLPSNTGYATATDFCPNGNATVTYSDAQSGGVCPNANMITRVWKATDNCGFQSYCPQYITVGTGAFCNLLVSNTGDSGIGTLRSAISCAVSGDTIVFHSSLAGTTIIVNTSKLILSKNLFIRSSITPKVKIKSTIAGLFDITAGYTTEFKDLDITSGLS
ncbi:MAG: hypothetical protein ABIQ02_06550, partial [Saprospiraceae bacterium]